MKPVYQQIVNTIAGDCGRACVASMFEMEIDAVPNFNRHGDNWWNVYCHFIHSIGYEVKDCIHVKYEEDYPTRKDLINGCIYAVVKSRTFKERSNGSEINHAVLINSKGTVVHDPNPNKKFLGVNVIETGELRYWDKIRKQNVGA